MSKKKCTDVERGEQIIKLLWEGMHMKEIAEQLGLSAKYARMARMRAERRYGAKTTAHLMRRALEAGLLTL